MTSGASDQRPVILFVDDNQALLNSIERLLRMEGYQVLLASDGLQALAILEAADPLPELIISDVMMPTMDGFALFAEVRRRDLWVNIPFLFLTARDQIDDLERAYDLGVDDYLVKPFDHERLVMIVRAKLKRRREWMTHLASQQEALDRAKQDLVTLVAHELRTPLVSITMVSDILTREIGQLDQNHLTMMLDTMQGGSLRLNRLVEQMVMYVQLQSGVMGDTICSRMRTHLLRDVVIGAVDRARQFAYRQSEVPVRFEEIGSGLMVYGDASALQQALAEVLSNAMAFSPEGRAVFVRLYRGDGLVWCCAADHGPGIPENEIERVFEPFYQVARRHYEQQGMGIGLALARGVVHLHGGVIELQSAVGYGTEVRVGLPACREDDL